MKDYTMREMQVLLKLLQDGRSSDRSIAQELDTSRSNITKIRHRLEESGRITHYQAQINLQDADLHVHAMTFFRWRDYAEKEQTKQLIKHVAALPQAIMFTRGSGLGGKSKCLASVHKDLQDYEEFIRKLQERFGEQIADVDVFLSSIDTMHKKYDLTSPIQQVITEQLDK